MKFHVAIALIPIWGFVASAPSNSDVTQTSPCAHGCQILVVDTFEADKRCQDNVRTVHLHAGYPVTLALEGAVCRPGNSSVLHVCRGGFWIKKPKSTIDCPDDIVDTVESGQSGNIVSWEQPPNVVASKKSGSLFPIGTTEVILEDVDRAMIECSFTVTITEPKSTIDCPDDTVDTVESGQSGNIVSWEQPPNVVASKKSGSLFPIGTTVVILEDVDRAMIECSFTVTITDV
ncbi:hyalin-like [Haliotis asinina]|uniref:hyalin-like n=1 Tax=Haliotis asinina TaxID=109174 RepID=UPI003531C8D8